MSEYFCDTSPLQYLHQIGLLEILHGLTGNHLFIPPAVANELDKGRAHGVDLPDITRLSWISVRAPRTEIPFPKELGPGEVQVLTLALETAGSIAILDDGWARHVAAARNLSYIGTLGLLIRAKRVGLIGKIAPILDQLQALRFRISESTRAAVLKLAEEPN
ncbi:DUF3368 domain-containing protein [Candidatus Sumerlaeota bacterium]|nr:DUF3368 domain-containing protein [Candidatus Sumerlaeota bacterium]MBI3735128.1 DUF3368 domain-containing protein [Candidatus Sumerlaeota bacterium]